MLDVLPTLEEVEAELCRRSLAEFVRQAWHILEPETPLVWNWHLDAICEHLELVTLGHINRLIVNIPPGHMKSLLVSVFWPVWSWIHRPGWRLLSASYGADLSVRDSAKSRTVLESAWFTARFPHVELSRDTNAKDAFRTTRGGERTAISVGGKTTGLRADGVLIDDPHNALEVFSAAAREQVKTWLDVGVGNRLNDMRTGFIVVMMQRLHEDDATAHLLAQGGWTHLRLPSEFDPRNPSVTVVDGLEVWRDPRTEPGELLFPAKFPASVLAVEKRRMQSNYAGQHNQVPVSSEGGMFKRTWWRRYRTLPKEAADRGEWAMSVDASFKGRNDAAKGRPPDYCALHVWWKHGGAHYLVHATNKRLSFTELRAALLSVKARYPRVGPIYVEEGANGVALLDALRADEGVSGLIGVKTEGRAKEARAAAVTHWVEAGDVWLPEEGQAGHWDFDDEGCPVTQFVDQLASFPRARNDDQVDALSQYLHKAAIDEVVWKGPKARAPRASVHL